MTFPPQELNRTVLDNGLVVLSEYIPQSASCGLGLWLRQGSSAEADCPHGITHLLEHMYFKGTGKRSAREISEEVESRGGQINASTGRSSMSLYTSSLIEDWELCLDILCDMVTGSRFDEMELCREQDVIADEIRTVEESPEEELYDRAFQDMLPGSPWGHPVQGSEDSVYSVNRPLLKSYAERQLQGSNLILSLAGDLRHGVFREAVQERLAGLEAGCKPQLQPPVGIAGRRDYQRDSGRQAHVQIGRTGPLAGDDDQTAIALMNVALGDGMSSRLFQKLREDRGLCYNVYTWQEGLGAGSSFGICFSCDLAKVEEVEQACQDELRLMAREGLKDSELERTRRQMRGGLLLGQEQSMNRMVMLASGEHRQGRLVSLHERVNRIERIGRDELMAAAERWFDPEGFHVTRLMPKGA